MKNEIMEHAREWIHENFDPATTSQLQQWINGNEEQLIQSAFEDYLIIGYDGWRKPYGPGLSNFNNFSVGRITQALINYLRKQYPNEKIKIALAYDGRQNSNLYAQGVAKVISGNDHVAYYFPTKIPLSMLSFFIREKRCKAGIMITASEDTKEMNGLKLYGHNGAQLNSAQLQEIIKDAKNIRHPADIPKKDNCGLIRFVPEEYEERFINIAVDTCHLEAEEPKNIRIVYSPLHGNGADFIPEVLERAGFKNVFQVAAQSDADENFATVSGNPSPDNLEVFRLSLDVARKEDADIIFVTDPDCDKLGIACKNRSGEFEALTSEEVAILLWDYLLASNKKLPENCYVIKSIMASPILNKIAGNYGVTCLETAPEFSSVIAELNKQEALGEKNFVAAADINMSILLTDKLRDKDAVTTIAVLASMTNALHNKGITLLQKLNELYCLHGYYYERNFSIEVESQGEAARKNIFEKMLQNPPQSLSYLPLDSLQNYATNISTTFKTGHQKPFTDLYAELISFQFNSGKIFVYPSSSKKELQCSIHIWRAPVTHLFNAKVICARKASLIVRALKEYPYHV